MEGISRGNCQKRFAFSLSENYRRISEETTPFYSIEQYSPTAH
jgi:hypothetical protein